MKSYYWGGCFRTAGLGQAPARQAALEAGMPYEISALTINKVCGSGLKAIMLAAQAIRAGEADIIIAGGQESMTNVPYYLQKARFGYYYGNGQLIDGVEYDGLRDPFSGILMGNTGEIIAEKYKVTREEADTFSLRSHKLALNARTSEWIKDEIIPLTVKSKKGDKVIKFDDGPREDTNIEALSKLKPAFKQDGIVTAGNASSLNDGAAAVIVMSKFKAQELNLELLATIKSYVTNGVKPENVMEAPIFGVKKLMERSKEKIDDIDILEHNEAFASASVAVQRELNIPEENFNPRGGAVALGHPLGASGARVLVTLLSELKRRDKNKGVCTVCLGGGNAVSMLIER
ncbi:MAG: Acetyl-CoA acetyltransferase [Candidatus Heimdallarchaeota archaeon LC_3]|nr:MAG: Acetyl-CoA acetyltransferase [Candidatus Heimdallarchaeota archaeon LC_3]